MNATNIILNTRFSLMHSFMFLQLLQLFHDLLCGVVAYPTYVPVAACAAMLPDYQMTNESAQNTSFPFVFTVSPSSFNPGDSVTGVYCMYSISQLHCNLLYCRLFSAVGCSLDLIILILLCTDIVLQLYTYDAVSLSVSNNDSSSAALNGTNATYFEGFFFEARVPAASAPIGVWTVLDSANQALVACGGVASSAIGHSNPNSKTATSARWTALSSLTAPNILFLCAALPQYFDSIQKLPRNFDSIFVARIPKT